MVFKLIERRHYKFAILVQLLIVFILVSIYNSSGTQQTVYDHVPDVIVQFGNPRTATTLQFHILCVMMAVTHANEVENVGCKYDKFTDTKYQVIKQHKLIHQSLIDQVPKKSWLFMTTGNNQTRFERQFRKSVQTRKSRQLVIPYVVNMSLAIERGHSIVYEYRKYFGIDDAMMEHIVEYFRYWDILRICCGMQMSKSWRTVLHARGETGADPRYQKLGHRCDAYDISAVENLMMNTYIYKKFAHIPTLSHLIGKPSDVDKNLDGKYCKTCNKNVSIQKLEFNHPCV